MAVPKRKTTPSRRGMRRSHQALKPVNVVVDPVTGEQKLPHHISLDGYYNGREIFEAPEVDDTEDDDENA